MQLIYIWDARARRYDLRFCNANLYGKYLTVLDEDKFVRECDVPTDYVLCFHLYKELYTN